MLLFVSAGTSSRSSVLLLLLLLLAHRGLVVQSRCRGRVGGGWGGRGLRGEIQVRYGRSKVVVGRWYRGETEH